MSEWRIICGDVEEVLREYPATHFDACLCDPPYGLSFMGNRWDYQVPGVNTWREVLRVLKPGAPLLAFGGTRTVHRVTVNIEDAGFDIEDSIAWLHGQGKPATKYRLKPAHEPIVLGRRPYAGTLALNLARWGVGALAIDACRVVTRDKITPFGSPKRSKGGIMNIVAGPRAQFEQAPGGRWPANVILDDAASRMLDEQTGILKTHGHTTPVSRGMGYSGKARGRMLEPVASEEGGASRFFYCAKPRGEETAGNSHPTKKPVALTEYLARLILPAQPGTLLIPFAGSGSEVLGALRAGWPSVLGIEREASYIAIAEGRLNAA